MTLTEFLLTRITEDVALLHQWRDRTRAMPFAAVPPRMIQPRTTRRARR